MRELIPFSLVSMLTKAWKREDFLGLLTMNYEVIFFSILNLPSGSIFETS